MVGTASGGSDQVLIATAWADLERTRDARRSRPRPLASTSRTGSPPSATLRADRASLEASAIPRHASARASRLVLRPNVAQCSSTTSATPPVRRCARAARSWPRSWGAGRPCPRDEYASVALWRDDARASRRPSAAPDRPGGLGRARRMGRVATAQRRRGRARADARLTEPRRCLTSAESSLTRSVTGLSTMVSSTFSVRSVRAIGGRRPRATRMGLAHELTGSPAAQPGIGADAAGGSS